MHIELELELKKITSGAFICTDGDEDYVIPQSIIDFELTEIEEEGDTGTIWVERWFAQQEGLI